MLSFSKSHSLLKILDSTLVSLPCPSSLTFWWNFGSILGLCLTRQLVRGVFLALNFSADVGLSFEIVRHLSQDVDLGWFLRTLHANGARFFFFRLYFHAGRGLYYGSYSLNQAWGAGVLILLLVIATAFLGYVLPWGQMSFWGTTVITNLLSAIPFIGKNIVIWLWGGFAVINPTLTRFFAFHFLLPFIVTRFVGVHLLFIHNKGSSNRLGLNRRALKIPFHKFFSFKDVILFFPLLILLNLLRSQDPWILGDPENFLCANPLVTPVHIQPEWYFLFAYAILRSIPNKLGGVVALALAVLILLVARVWNNSKFKSFTFYPINKILFWTLVRSVMLLTWIGARPVEEPYVLFGQVLTLLYFRYFFPFSFNKKKTRYVFLIRNNIFNS